MYKDLQLEFFFTKKNPRCGKIHAIIFGPSHNDHLAVKNNNIETVYCH